MVISAKGQLFVNILTVNRFRGIYKIYIPNQKLGHQKNQKLRFEQNNQLTSLGICVRETTSGNTRSVCLVTFHFLIQLLVLKCSRQIIILPNPMTKCNEEQQNCYCNDYFQSCLKELVVIRHFVIIYQLNILVLTENVKL